MKPPTLTSQGPGLASVHRNEKPPFKIAIVGVGPRGGFALEEIARLYRKKEMAENIDIHLYERDDYPGAGPVYNPRQAEYLKMNFASGNIDARPDISGRSLCDWLERNHPQCSAPTQFIPRAWVGQYLSETLEETLASLPDSITVTLHKGSVTSVTRVGGNWRLSLGGSAQCFDEVLVTVGHGQWKRHTERELPDISKVKIFKAFPVDQNLTEEVIPAGSRVATKGYALTWIDSVLALTEGRGGTFEETGGRLSYKPSGKEPECITPFSRSGKPLLSKPDLSVRKRSESFNEKARALSAELKESVKNQRQIDFRATVWPVLTELAQSQCSDEDVQVWLDDWMSEETFSTRSLTELRRSYEVAIGKAEPGPAYAWGEAWRRLYPDIVGCVSHGRIDPSSWEFFQTVATEMERLSFGPPACNVRKILCLIDCGLVDVSSPANVPESADQVVDTTIPQPTAVSDDSLLGTMIAELELERDVVTGGLKVDSAGYVRPGLAVLGRVCEGWILGHDTLNRTLHSELNHWTDRLLQRVSTS